MLQPYASPVERAWYYGMRGLVGLILAQRTEQSVEHYAALAVFVLGIVSAAIPPRTPEVKLPIRGETHE